MYQSLYRKYRPRKFSEVYGQDVAKQILINAIKNNKISHAYLFFGPRGTGKTSIAKMFARICNCENYSNGECCEKCEYCIESNQKNCVDIIEIDAASNNGVDEIRELKNKINLVPNKLKYKVYIIDEVHMLSTGAFNALLKTLEEPPSHVIFILATTEFYKVPDTIVSRCQTIEFKNIDNVNMSNRLNEIAKLEKIDIDQKAIDEIIKNSNGGMRDAIGLLDKINSYCPSGNRISDDDVRKSLGVITISEIEMVSNLLIESKYDELLSKIDEYAETGVDLLKVVEELIYYFRNKIIAQKEYNLLEIINWLNHCQAEMKKSFNEKIAFEIKILEQINKTNVCNKNQVVSQNISREIFLEENNNKIDSKIIDIRINNSFVNANKSTLNNFKNLWGSLKEYAFENENGALICDLLDCMPIVCSNTNVILCAQYDSLCEKINSNLKIYEKIICTKLNSDKKIVAITKEQWDELKNDYMKKIKGGYEYLYISEDDEPKIEKKDDNNLNKNDIIEKAEMLFGKIVNEEE